MSKNKLKSKAKSKSREPKTSPRRLKAAKKQAEALELRIKGESYRAIAKQLRYAGPAGSYQAVTAALENSIYEPTDELIRLELERLDELQIIPWALGKAGDMGAVDKVLKIMERRSKLLGLDHPVQYSLEDIRGIANKVHAVVLAEVEEEEVRERIFAKLGFTDP